MNKTKKTEPVSVPSYATSPRIPLDSTLKTISTQRKAKPALSPGPEYNIEELNMFINFENETDMQATIKTKETQFIKNFIVYWTKADTKTCHICQSKEHLAADCSRLQDKIKNERKISKLATLYTKKRVETSGAKSVINKANSIQKGKKTYSQT